MPDSFCRLRYLCYIAMNNFAGKTINAIERKTTAHDYYELNVNC